ncbi:MAG: hypothetical protein MJ071_04925 [Oscillospiraceae bacterium]|nr:hypothetical protein [Oscillospiraceae bacterium]
MGNHPETEKKKKKPANQWQQIAVMAAVLLVCAVLVTWTVLLMRERLGMNQSSQQLSDADIIEMTGNNPQTAETTTVTKVTGLSWGDALEGDEESTTVSVGSVTTITTVSTKRVPATAPATAPLKTQPAQFSAIGTTAKRGSSTAAPRTTTTRTTAKTEPPHTTHQEVQPPTNVSKPSGAQITYNQMLALYLGTQQGGYAAYFGDSYGHAKPFTVSEIDSSLYLTSAAAGVKSQLLLGGTGSTTKLVTNAPYHLFLCTGNNTRSLFYTSEGLQSKILGYYDAAGSGNVWAEIQYVQTDTQCQAFYTIYHWNAQGAAEVLASGMTPANAMYDVTFESFASEWQQILEDAHMIEGSTVQYTELEANSTADLSTLWSKSGSYNSGFSLQGNSIYGVVCCSNNENANLRAGTTTASNIVASVPSGSFVCVETQGKLSGWVPVSVLVNGTWHSGYMSSDLLTTWQNHTP